MRTARGLDFAALDRENPFQLPESTADTAVLTTARLFLEEGAAVKDRLVELGLSSAWLDRLREATDRLDKAIAGRRSGRRELAAGRAGMAAAMALGTRAVSQFDIVVTNLLGDEPALLAAWRRDRRVVAGRSRGDAGEPSGRADSCAGLIRAMP